MPSRGLGQLALAAPLLVFAACAATSKTASDGGCTRACALGFNCHQGHCVLTTCTSSGDCAGSEQCVGGFCADVGCAPPCPLTQVCLSQLCLPKVAPSCASSADCPDGDSCVGGYCTQTGCLPPCPPGQVCLDGLCLPPGGAGCTAPYVTCSGASGATCANLGRDSANCGACGDACSAGEVCNGLGVCAASCSPTEAECAGRCVDEGFDQTNCGACGNACAAGEACSGGACTATCAAPFASCGAAGAAYCADLQHDPANCGACALACQPTQHCGAGTCAPAVGAFRQDAQRANWNGATPAALTATLPGPVAAGDLLVVATVQEDGTSPAVSDSLGDAFHLVDSNVQHSATVYATLSSYYAVTVDAGADAITIDLGLAGIPNVGLYVAEYAGLGSASLVGHAATAVLDAGAAANADSVSAAGDGGALVWAISFDGWTPTTVAAGAGFTARGGAGLWPSGPGACVEDAPASGGATQTATWTIGSPQAQFLNAELVFQ